MPIIRFYFVFLAAALVFVVAVAGFRGQRGTGRPFEIFNDMDHQPKRKSQAPSVFFQDGRADRPVPAGTVSRVMPVGDDRYYGTGQLGDQWGRGFPASLPVDRTLLARGAERYSIHCAVCHGATGAANGITTKYGLVGVADFHTERLRDMPEGQIFNTITHGYGQMGAYPHIAPSDRWAIIAYIRQLQAARFAVAAELPEPLQRRLPAK